MSRRTETERMLLDALEMQASQMSSIEALVNILSEWDIYGDDSMQQEERMKKRMQAINVLESIAHLARFYHDEAMTSVNRIYHGGG